MERGVDKPLLLIPLEAPFYSLRYFQPSGAVVEEGTGDWWEKAIEKHAASEGPFTETLDLSQCNKINKIQADSKRGVKNHHHHLTQMFSLFGSFIASRGFIPS